MFGKDDFFHHRLIVILGHKMFRTARFRRAKH